MLASRRSAAACLYGCRVPTLAVMNIMPQNLQGDCTWSTHLFSVLTLAFGYNSHVPFAIAHTM
jgi:hypothetical protein